MNMTRAQGNKLWNDHKNLKEKYNQRIYKQNDNSTKHKNDTKVEAISKRVLLQRIISTF